MDAAPSPVSSPAAMQRLRRSAALFVAIGLVLYAALFWVAEGLVQRTGHSNPFFKIATMERPAVDWVILGTSHAMPLDFDGFNALMERGAGLVILNLAATGTGPLYSRFVLEHFLAQQRTRHVLFVADSFVFYSRTWNEERFADAKLLARTPMQRALTARFVDYAFHEGVPAGAVLDYATGFSKINNRDRFKPDRWEGEAQFDRSWRPSTSAVKKRVDYLYPDGATPDRLERYMGELSRLIAVARRAGASVTVIKLPTPAAFRSQLPGEAPFDAALARLTTQAGVPLHDFSASIDEPRFYFDSDHLNRTGATRFFQGFLRNVLVDGTAAPPP